MVRAASPVCSDPNTPLPACVAHLRAGRCSNTDGALKYDATEAGAKCVVTALDNVRVTHLAIFHQGKHGVNTGLSATASLVSAFKSDYRGGITFQATNMAGLSATCSSKVSTFTTSLEWPSVAATMNLKGETVADGGDGGVVYSDTTTVYHINTSYTVAGPEGCVIRSDIITRVTWYPSLAGRSAM